MRRYGEHRQTWVFVLHDGFDGRRPTRCSLKVQEPGAQKGGSDHIQGRGNTRNEGPAMPASVAAVQAGAAVAT